jgi:PAS domain-containing protein
MDGGLTTRRRKPTDSKSRQSAPAVAIDAILESISDGVFTIDKDWRVSSFNRLDRRLAGAMKNGEPMIQGRP